MAFVEPRGISRSIDVRYSSSFPVPLCRAVRNLHGLAQIAHDAGRMDAERVTVPPASASTVAQTSNPRVTIGRTELAGIGAAREIQISGDRGSSRSCLRKETRLCFPCRSVVRRRQWRDPRDCTTLCRAQLYECSVPPDALAICRGQLQEDAQDCGQRHARVSAALMPAVVAAA
jgi:hypothetical protein